MPGTGSSRKTLTIGIVIILLGISPLAAQQGAPGGRPLAIEDYYRMQTVGGLLLSPDGKWVSFTVATRIEEDNSTRSEVFLAAADGSGEPRRVLHYGRDVTDPGFMPDGWFSYSVDGRWKVDPKTPSQPPLPAPRENSRSYPSPDGKWVASFFEVPRPAPPPASSSDFERRHQERFEGAIFDWRDFQRDGRPFPTPDERALPARRIQLAAASGGAPRTLVDLDLRPATLVWHPGSRRLLFIADSHWRDELHYERPDLWTVDIDGELTRLTDDLYTYSSPGFSPDGRFISYLRSFGTDMVIEQKLNHGGPRDLFVLPLSGGEPVNLTADWDLEPGSPDWSPDGRFLYFTATTGGEVHLFRAGAGGGGVEQVTHGPRRLSGLVIDRDFRTLAYLAERHDAPAEVYVSRIDGSGERQLTRIHQAFTSEVALSRAEREQWSSPDGTRIEGWLTFPYGYQPEAGPYPMIVFSHGGPHSATGYRFDFKQQFFAAQGYFVLDTNFRSSTGYGEAFKWATWGEWGNKDGQDVVSGIDHVLAKYPIDPNRVGHTGHSYGGFMTNWLITRYPERFAAAISGAGISNWISDYGTADIYRTKETEFFGPPWDAAARDRMIRQSPISHAGNVRTPTLFVHGEVDQRVPYEEGEQMYFALKRRGIPTRMIRYAGQPHGIRGHWNNVHRIINELNWWNRYLNNPGKGSTARDRP